jgi:hypothetical protein
MSGNDDGNDYDPSAAHRDSRVVNARFEAGLVSRLTFRVGH